LFSDHFFELLHWLENSSSQENTSYIHQRKFYKKLPTPTRNRPRKYQAGFKMNNTSSNENNKADCFYVDNIRYQATSNTAIHQTSNEAKAEITTLIILEMLNDKTFGFDVTFKNLIDVGVDQGLSRAFTDGVLAGLFESNQIKYSKDEHNNIIVKAVISGGIDHG
jgi:hypothetical protein